MHIYLPVTAFILFIMAVEQKEEWELSTCANVHVSTV